MDLWILIIFPELFNNAYMKMKIWGLWIKFIWIIQFVHKWQNTVHRIRNMLTYSSATLCKIKHESENGIILWLSSIILLFHIHVLLLICMILKIDKNKGILCHWATVNSVGCIYYSIIGN